MFSTSKMGVCVAAMMMMMMMLAAAMPKEAGHSKRASKPHRKSPDEAAMEMVPLQLDHNTLVPSTQIRPLQNSSTSPWTYNMSLDNSALPSVLSEARCLLRGCLDSEGREDLNLESRPIMHQVLLLRRVKSAGAGSGAGSGAGHSYHYRLESRLIAVGCTCVRPTVRHQD